MKLFNVKGFAPLNPTNIKLLSLLTARLMLSFSVFGRGSSIVPPFELDGFGNFSNNFQKV